jgi:hypothetical protein
MEGAPPRLNQRIASFEVVEALLMTGEKSDRVPLEGRIVT